jgi:hypothetical protein
MLGVNWEFLKTHKMRVSYYSSARQQLSSHGDLCASSIAYSKHAIMLKQVRIQHVIASDCELEHTQYAWRIDLKLSP